MGRKRSALAVGCFGGLAVSLFVGAAARGQSRAAFEAAITSACGPDGVRPHARFEVGNGKVEPALPGKARVYFIDVLRGPRSSLEDGLSIAADGRWVGALNGRSQFSVTLDPGEHHFCVRVDHRNGSSWRAKAQRLALLDVRVKAGETIFLAARAMFPNSAEDWLWHAMLRQINCDEGRLLVATAARSVEKGGHR